MSFVPTSVNGIYTNKRSESKASLLNLLLSTDMLCGTLNLVIVIKVGYK